jgi:hypothetical protein
MQGLCKQFGREPIEITLLDDTLNQLYKQERNLAKLISISGLITIIVTIMGGIWIDFVQCEIETKNYCNTQNQRRFDNRRHYNVKPEFFNPVYDCVYCRHSIDVYYCQSLARKFCVQNSGTLVDICRRMHTCIYNHSINRNPAKLQSRYC